MISAFRGLFLFLFLLGTISVFAQTESKVFVTKTSAKYHRSTCRYSQTGWKAKHTEAKERKLTGCLVCKPVGGATTQTSSSSKETNSLMSTIPSASKSAATTISSQCRATTKAGSQCSRKASAGSSYSRQHAS